jgi:hypothetical protein
MIYDDGVELAEDMSVVECPRCENEEFGQDAEFCRICGLTTQNKCDGYWDEYHDCQVQHNNPSNARYCESCGQPTSFFKEGILKSWEEVKNKVEDDDPFAEAVATEDDYDDIPF